MMACGRWGSSRQVESSGRRKKGDRGMSKGTGPGMVLVKVEMARNAAGWKGTIVGWPETREKKRRRQATPRCGRHVRLYEPAPPSVPFAFLPSSARRFPSLRGCNGGRGGNLKMGSVLAGCAYRQSFSSPPPRGQSPVKLSGTPMRGSRWTDHCLGAVPRTQPW